MKEELTRFIKESALKLGFDACGIAKAELLKEDKQFLTQWLAENRHGSMSYLERNFEKRTDPRMIVEGAQSLIVTLTNYFPAEMQVENAPKISKYAYSKIDYHTIIKENLLKLENLIIGQYGEACFNSKQQHRFVDSAPVLERRWAERAGLGWIGKNKMLISPTLGSFTFIGILMINEELIYDEPMPNRCGTCTRCLAACPTNAIKENEGIDARRCISYQTIERKAGVEDEIKPLLSGYAFGCDICNDVCPWNKTRARPTKHKAFEIVPEILSFDYKAWKNLDKTEFKRIFKESAILRAGYERLQQNILDAEKN